MSDLPIPHSLKTLGALSNLAHDAAVFIARQVALQTLEIARRRHPPCLTLRPGKGTPLWNDLRNQLRPLLRRYGDQVNLGRELGLPRQRINEWVTRGGRMPDAERTLQLVAWLLVMKTRPARRPQKRVSPNG